MNFEESRLRTFINWPANAPVDARRIAKAGFYYLGQGLDVKCFSCGGVISDWNYNDKVMTLHRALDPRCPFVLSPALSGNVPIISNTENQANVIHDEGNSSNSETNNEVTSSTTSATPSSEDDMFNELSRLNSFHSWPISFIVTPESLAKAGFYYVQQGDKVKCPYCCVIIDRWEVGDIPLEEHRRHSPTCSFVHSTSEVDSTDVSGITFRESAGSHSHRAMKSLGVQSHRVAKHPKYTSKDSRLATFTTWPGDVTQTPNDLAEAGFYYAGSDDQVRCFHCNGGLRKWDPTDDPWVEHARWFPDCGFIMLVKGERFIRDSIVQYPPIVPELTTCMMPTVTRSGRVCNPSRNHSVSEEDLESLMNSPTAIAALQIGLDLSRVKMAFRHKLENSGVPFSSADDLIEATLDIQLDEVPFQDSEETWSTPMHSPLRQRFSSARSAPRGQQQSSQDSSDSSESDNNSHQKTKPSLHLAEKPVPDNGSEDGNPSCNSERKVTLEEENRRLKEARLCKICMDSEVCIVFLPCGHLVTCVNCAHSLADCPVCRRTIKATVRTFLS